MRSILPTNSLSLYFTVRKAREWKISLVTYDWLEDSLMAKPCRPLKVGPYLWDRQIQKESTEKPNGKKGKPGRKPGQKNSPKQKEVDTGTSSKKPNLVL